MSQRMSIEEMDFWDKATKAINPDHVTRKERMEEFEKSLSKLSIQSEENHETRT